MRDGIKEFWDDLISKTVVLRFKVTDRALALETLTSQLKNASIPGLEVSEIILVDQAQRAKEFTDDLGVLLDKYSDII